MLGFAEGKLEKLTVNSYKDSKYKEDKRTYKALINPETYTENYKIQYSETKIKGQKEGEKKFTRVPPNKLSLQFVFDSTGLVNNEISFGTNLFGSNDATPVPDQIDEFMKVVFDYKGDIHQPRYVSIIWGKSKRKPFKGRLDTVDIKYTLFKPDGTAIRAVANASFTTSIDKETEKKEKTNTSPDLTHVRTVKGGDTLPLLAFEIYGDSSLYMELARVNKLKNVRKLKVGTQLIFPPIDKKTA